MTRSGATSAKQEVFEGSVSVYFLTVALSLDGTAERSMRHGYEMKEWAPYFWDVSGGKAVGSQSKRLFCQQKGKCGRKQNRCQVGLHFRGIKVRASEKD